MAEKTRWTSNCWVWNLTAWGPSSCLCLLACLKFISVYWCFVYMYICATHVCLVPSETREECQIPWNRSWHRQWWVMRILAIKPASSGREASALNHWATSPALLCLDVPPKWHGCTRVHTLSQALFFPWFKVLYLAQAGLKLLILLHCLPRAGITGVHTPPLSCSSMVFCFQSSSRSSS